MWLKNVDRQLLIQGTDFNTVVLIRHGLELEPDEKKLIFKNEIRVRMARHNIHGSNSTCPYVSE